VHLVGYFHSYFDMYYRTSRFQWPRGLRRRSAAARLLRLWVRIPPGSWMFVCCECCVLSGRVLCDELITRLEESYRLWCVVLWDLETSWMRRPWPTGGWGLLSQIKKKIIVLGRNWVRDTCTQFCLRIPWKSAKGRPCAFILDVNGVTVASVSYNCVIFERYITFVQSVLRHTVRHVAVLLYTINCYVILR